LIKYWKIFVDPAFY